MHLGLLSLHFCYLLAFLALLAWHCDSDQTAPPFAKIFVVTESTILIII